jgi:hypothetical protein
MNSPASMSVIVVEIVNGTPTSWSPADADVCPVSVSSPSDANCESPVGRITVMAVMPTLSALPNAVSKLMFTVNVDSPVGAAASTAIVAK